jgi:hypothetical protein
MNRLAWVVVVVAACGGSSKPAAPAQPAAVAPPAGCAQYRDEVSTLLRCPKLAPGAKDQLQQSVDALASTWVDFDKQPPAAQGAIVSGCKTAYDALVQAAPSLCGS